MKLREILKKNKMRTLPKTHTHTQKKNKISVSIVGAVSNKYCK